MDERRKFPRLDIAVDVCWEHAAADKQREGKGDPHATKNISAGGISLIVYENVSVGEPLNLHIELPDHRMIHAVGRVVWSSPFEVSSDTKRNRRDIGIEFLKIAPEDQEAINKFVWSNRA